MCLGAITSYEEAALKTRRNNKTGTEPHVAISQHLRPMLLDDVVRVLERPTHPKYHPNQQFRNGKRIACILTS
jgi:hypothetical protein